MRILLGSGDLLELSDEVVQVEPVMRFSTNFMILSPWGKDAF